MKKGKKKSLSAFSILMIVLAAVCLITLLANGQAIDSDIIKSLETSSF